MVPWDRTPAGIGSPGVRVLYGMKNGKAGMMLTIRDYRAEDLADAAAIWTAIVEQGDSFPGDAVLPPEEADRFFRSQTRTAMALDGGERVGLYVLHPNNIGRCSHIANASYGVKAGLRGRGIGRALVLDSLESARALGFRGLQFNAVVAENAAAIALYEQLGFVRLGTVPGGYRRADGRYVDTYVYFHDLRG